MKFLTKMQRATRVCVSTLAIAGLTACGGDDSPSSPNPTPTPIASPPAFTSAGTVSVVENTSQGFYTAAANDPNGGSVTISLYAGADAGSFVLENGGVLRFNTPPNFDLPADANFDNVYEVTLRATVGQQSADLPLRITVTNDREGIVVSRLLSGLNETVGMGMGRSAGDSSLENLLVVAERSGRVFEFDPATGVANQNIFIRDNKKPGEILAVAYGFPGSIFQEAIYILTYDPAGGLLLQAFNDRRGYTGFYKLGDALPSGAPAASMVFNGSLLVAVGDPSGNLAQNASSPYGKLIELQLVDPYAGASLPYPIILRPSTIGDGIQKPGGFTLEYGKYYLSDQGSSVENEVTIFDPKSRPLDFGWPFYEGSKSLRSGGPAIVNGPKIVYPFGTGKREGTGVIGGVLNDYRFFPQLGNTFVFGDRSGKIWTIGYDKLIDGALRRVDMLENRSEDFTPNRGQIDEPVAITSSNSSDRFYILDRDGEIFQVRGAQQ